MTVESKENKKEDLEKALAEKDKLIQEHWDQLLRSRAELENTRKRSDKAAAEAILYGQASVLERLLPLWDQLRSGLEQLEIAGADPKVKEGLALVLKNMEQMFESCGLGRVEVLQGKPYDPHLHEVIQTQESEQEEGVILGVAQDGFVMNGRVLRPAKVIVSKKK